MAVYEIQTDNGTYQVETDEPSQAQSFNPSDIKGNLKQDTLAAAPILPAAGAIGSAIMGGAQWLSNKLGPHAPALPQNASPTSKPQIPYSLKDDKLAAVPVLPAGLLGIKGPGATGGGLLDSTAPNAAEANPADYDPNLLNRIPSKARASTKLNSVRQNAGSAPVDMSKAGDIALKMRSGINVTPPTVNRFLSRVTNPNLPPPTLDESMDMASDAGQTAFSDKMNMTANTRRQMKEFRKALADANAEAADKAGQGDQFRQGMSEYSQNAKIRKAATGVVGAGLLGPLYGKTKKYAGLLGVELP